MFRFAKLCCFLSSLSVIAAEVIIDKGGKLRLVNFPKIFSSSLSLSTNTQKLKEVPEDDLNVIIHYHTDGSQWVASFYNGLQLDMHLNSGNYKLVYRKFADNKSKTGERFCSKLSNAASADDKSKWQAIHILPTNLDEYEYKGEETVRNIRAQKWQAPVNITTDELLGQGAEKARVPNMHFYVDSMTGAPIRWVINRARNPIWDAHTDDWVVDYFTFEPWTPSDQLFELPLDCAVAVVSDTLDLAANPTLHGFYTRSFGKKLSPMKSLRGKLWSPPTMDTPQAFDWDEQGFAGPIKDQGFCGSCWAFAMASVVASRYSIYHFRQGHAVKFPELSEQQILDCGWTDQSEACGGGEFSDAMLGDFEFALAGNYGGYLSVDGRCHQAPVFLKTVGWKSIDMRGLNLEARGDVLRRALVSEGPLGVNLKASPELIAYTGGVLDVDSCADTKLDEQNHALVLVGYGTHVLPYWNVKNSWSLAWGEGGYFRISAKKDCGLSLTAAFPILSSEDTLITPENEAIKHLLE